MEKRFKKIGEWGFFLFLSAGVVTALFGFDYANQLHKGELSVEGVRIGLYLIFGGMALTLLGLAISDWADRMVRLHAGK